MSARPLAEQRWLVQVADRALRLAASTTTGVISRQMAWDASITQPLLEACIATCKSCGDECARHAPRYEHCRVCEQACRRCEQACRELLGVFK